METIVTSCLDHEVKDIHLIIYTREFISLLLVSVSLFTVTNLFHISLSFRIQTPTCRFPTQLLLLGSSSGSSPLVI